MRRGRRTTARASAAVRAARRPRSRCARWPRGGGGGPTPRAPSPATRSRAPCRGRAGAAPRPAGSRRSAPAARPRRSTRSTVADGRRHGSADPRAAARAGAGRSPRRHAAAATENPPSGFARPGGLVCRIPSQHRALGCVSRFVRMTRLLRLLPQGLRDLPPASRIARHPRALPRPVPPRSRPAAPAPRSAPSSPRRSPPANVDGGRRRGSPPATHGGSVCAAPSCTLPRHRFAGDRLRERQARTSVDTPSMAASFALPGDHRRSPITQVGHFSRATVTANSRFRSKAAIRPWGPRSRQVRPSKAPAAPGRLGPEAEPTGQRARTVALPGADQTVGGAGPCATGRRERRGPSRLGHVNPAESQGLALGWTARLSATRPAESLRERFASGSPCGALKERRPRREISGAASFSARLAEAPSDRRPRRGAIDYRDGEPRA